MSVEMSEHFQERFRQRVAKTKRMQIFAERAYFYGKPVDSLQDSQFAEQLSKKEQEYQCSAKIYNNVVYWFHGNKAITLYPVPQKAHRRV